MVHTEKTRFLAKLIIYLISAHTAIYVLNNYAHGKIDMFYVWAEYTPIILIFCLVPLAAILFLSTHLARQASVVLLGILAAELIYNIYTRFAASTSFSVREPALLWKIFYEGSFGMMLVLEVIASWLAFNLLREIHKHLSPSSENPS